jgi:2'-5' RNA ligase superfamily/Aminoglycoside-2''-adenylyltransferase
MSAAPIQPSEPPTRRQPSLLYRLSARLNFVVWKLPLPRRVLVWLSQVVYRAPPMPGWMVLAIVGALEAASVRFWIIGGWGIDALGQRRTRTHRDLDVIVDDRDMERALDVMRDLGYEEWYRADSDVPLDSRIVLHESATAARVVDLHPLELSGTEMEVTAGVVEGRPVPCISAALQLKTHVGYRRRAYERADIALLRKLSEGPAITLIVPVPSAEDLLEDSAREPGMPAHINLVLPFLDAGAIDGESESRLASLLQTSPSFDFVLSKIGRFPGIIHVAAEPASPFVSLARAFAELWPERRASGGAGQEIVPHLTVACGTDTMIPTGLADRLPVTARAEQVWVMSRVAGRWTRRRALMLGQPTAPTLDAGAS